MRNLVTGATGLVGMHVVLDLLKKNEDVKATYTKNSNFDYSINLKRMMSEIISPIKIILTSHYKLTFYIQYFESCMLCCFLVSSMYQFIIHDFF